VSHSPAPIAVVVPLVDADEPTTHATRAAPAVTPPDPGRACAMNWPADGFSPERVPYTHRCLNHLCLHTRPAGSATLARHWNAATVHSGYVVARLWTRETSGDRSVTPDSTTRRSPVEARRLAMTQTQIRGPLQLLGELVLRENTRTLVIHGKDRTIIRLPLG